MVGEGRGWGTASEAGARVGAAVVVPAEEAGQVSLRLGQAAAAAAEGQSIELVQHGAVGSLDVAVGWPGGPA